LVNNSEFPFLVDSKMASLEYIGQHGLVSGVERENESFVHAQNSAYVGLCVFLGQRLRRVEVGRDVKNISSRQIRVIWYDTNKRV
jgi:hypothetical protein